MQYREFGKTGKKVSNLGFGCMRFPEKKVMVDGKEETVIDDDLAIPMVRKAIDMGVNYIDTAYGYHSGKSEAFVGRALAQGYREKVFVADKLPVYLIKEKNQVEKYFNEQFEKLGLDYIDFYLLHNMDRNYWKTVVDFDIVSFLKEKKADGKIGHIGFSFHDSFEVFKTIVDYFDWDFVQIQLNYVDEEYQAGIAGLEYVASKGMGLVIMEPLRGGNLVAKLPKEIDDKFKSVHPEYSAAKWALKYLYDKDEISVVLSGMSTMEQVMDNVETASMESFKLTDEEKTAVDTAKKVFKERVKVGCTQCKYCMPCPFGVNIPETFRFYNNASLFDEKEVFAKRLEELEKEGHGPSNCVNCRACLKRCPQSLQIPTLLDEAVEYFKN